MVSEKVNHALSACPPSWMPFDCTNTYSALTETGLVRIVGKRIDSVRQKRLARVPDPLSKWSLVTTKEGDNLASSLLATLLPQPLRVNWQSELRGCNVQVH